MIEKCSTKREIEKRWFCLRRKRTNSKMCIKYSRCRRNAKSQLYKENNLHYPLEKHFSALSCFEKWLGLKVCSIQLESTESPLSKLKVSLHLWSKFSSQGENLYPTQSPVPENAELKSESTNYWCAPSDNGTPKVSLSKVLSLRGAMQRRSLAFSIHSERKTVPWRRYCIQRRISTRKERTMFPPTDSSCHPSKKW